ncbi:MAG: 5-(carboxyamino)imidazole ribonucleotide synthase [Rhodospirillaceae bacterium]|nr:5-(carboxyamino)imidazole ribonucleotide synthase [Rhodospirillaceae bacterium]MBT6118860.1 5-(carboxyamino)imidazole ribonucleotide synthase [Rhodospirillaceae bacterium]
MGGGQLGRMTALAAAELGYRCHVFCPEKDGPTEQVAAAATIAAYDDGAALDAFASAVDVVTFEFENVPHESVQRLAGRVPVRPGWNVLRVSQDRLVEKRFIEQAGVPVTRFAEVTGLESLAAALAEIGPPAVLKTTRMGYDGKGQVMVKPSTDPAEAWAQMGGAVGILEGFVDFDCEVSVVVARGPDGATSHFEPVRNVHRDHILHTTTAPAGLAPETGAAAVDAALRIATALDVVGLLAVEMFVVRDGRVLVNEIAPRPHNSGHWTIDACACSQFEQFVRAVCGLPLGDSARHSDAVMTNLIGDEVSDWPALLAEPGACLHLYGKAEARPGRKMGHVTRLALKSGPRDG